MPEQTEKRDDQEKNSEIKLTKKEKKKFNALLKEHAVKARLAGSKFRLEFKNQTVTAITAAFAFLIALSWRTPIQDLVNRLVESFGLSGQAVYYEFLSAIIVTFVAVLALIFLSRWASEQK